MNQTARVARRIIRAFDYNFMAALHQIAVTILRVWPLLLLSSGIAGILNASLIQYNLLLIYHYYYYVACRFEYRKQPPSTTLSDCSPYQVGTNVIVINLECVVRKESQVTDDYEIRWYRENTTGGVEDLGQGDPDVRQGSVWSSRYHHTKLVNQQYNPSFAGKYWCQVINTTADPDQPLMRSNVFTLLPPDNYTGSTCTGSTAIQYINNVTCADLPEPDHSKTLFPSTTTSTRTSTSTSTTDLPTVHSTTNHHYCCDHTRTVTANHSTHTPAVTSSPSATLVMAILPPSSAVQQTIVFVLVPVVCVVLAILIILVVLILIVSRKKKTTRQTDLKGRNNSTRRQ